MGVQYFFSFFRKLKALVVVKSCGYIKVATTSLCSRASLFVLPKNLSTQSHFIFLVRTIFAPTKIFASGTKLQRFRRLALEAVKILSGEKILCSLTSIRPWVILQHMDYEVNVAV